LRLAVIAVDMERTGRLLTAMAGMSFVDGRQL
jgi:hypothetical protein